MSHCTGCRHRKVLGLSRIDPAVGRHLSDSLTKKAVAFLSRSRSMVRRLTSQRSRTFSSRKSVVVPSRSAVDAFLAHPVAQGLLYDPSSRATSTIVRCWSMTPMVGWSGDTVGRWNLRASRAEVCWWPSSQRLMKPGACVRIRLMGWRSARFGPLLTRTDS